MLHVALVLFCIVPEIEIKQNCIHVGVFSALGLDCLTEKLSGCESCVMMHRTGHVYLYGMYGCSSDLYFLLAAIVKHVL